MIHFIQEKLHTLSYRLELINECNRLLKSVRYLPKNYKKLIFKDPVIYDDFIQFLCFLDNNSVINLIDIGANKGEFAKNFLLFFPKCNTIKCFEPLSHLNNKIKINLNTKPDLKYQIINKALSNKTGKQKFYYDKNDTGIASLHRYNEDANEFFSKKYEVEEIMEVDLLDNFCKDFSRDDRFVVKIDTQGHEVEVIQGGMETIKRSSLIILECSFAPEYMDKEASFSECCTILKNLDFYPVIFQEYLKKISLYGIERDVIFVKKELLKKIYHKNY